MFLYYLPGKSSTATSADIERAGLAYAFETDSIQTREVFKGPDDGGGVIACGVSGSIGYYPERQTWRRVAGTGDARPWVGYETEKPPGPAELSRKKQIAGYSIELGDGNEWLIPIARKWLATDGGDLRWYVNLPKRLDIDDQGNWIDGPVIKSHQELWDGACRWWDFITEQADETMTYNEEGDTAALALGTNYCLGKTEIAMLGLLDDQVRSDILFALVDYPFLTEWTKKKEHLAGDGLHSSNGRSVEHTRTDTRQVSASVSSGST